MNGEPAPSRRALLALFLAWCSFWLGLSHGYLENTDAIVTLHAARAWWETGDPGLDPATADLTPGERDALIASAQLMRGTNGKYYAQFAIGHQALMVPAVALADLARSLAPGIAARQAEHHPGDATWGGRFHERFFASLLPVPFAALVAVALYLLARTLNCAHGDALRVMFITVLATGFGPGATETMSDVPGLAFLLVVALAAARYERGAGAGAAFGLGIAGGATVLVRYPNALPVAVFGTLVAVLALRRRSWKDLVALALGALPGVLALLYANHARFGSVTETGYSTGANAGWWDMPLRWGLPLVLFSPCKGIFWFSPALWTSSLGGLRRGGAFLFATLVAVVLPILLVAHTRGWSGAQCWSIRYLTPSVVLFVALGLALGRPWERWPRLVRLTTVLGLVGFVSGHAAPYRGHLHLAGEAARVAYAAELAAGKTTLAALSDQYFVDPHYSPLHGHPVYAWAALTGGLEAERLPETMRTMFAGVEVVAPVTPLLHEDRGFRHRLPFYLADLLRVPWWTLLLPWILLVAFLARRARRALATRAGGGTR